MARLGQIRHEFLTARATLTQDNPSAVLDITPMGIPTGNGLAVNTGHAPMAIDCMIESSTCAAGHNITAIPQADAAGPPVVHNRDKRIVVTAVPAPGGGEAIVVRCLVKYMYSPLGVQQDIDV